MTGEERDVNVAESLSLIAAFSSGVIFMLAASRPACPPAATPAGAERAPGSAGAPVIGAPPGWKP